MKHLIFLTQRRYDLYDIPNQTDIPRMVAVLTETATKQFPPEIKPFFDEIYSVPLAHQDADILSSFDLDHEAVCRIVEKEIAIAGGDVNKINIVSNDEFNMVLVGYLRDRYGIPGAGKAQLNLYRDKDLMKQQLAKHAIRVPKHQLLKTNIAADDLENYYQQLINDLGSSLIVKPVSGAGSIGTHALHDLSAFISLYVALCESGIKYEVEEFIEGDVYHCDSITQNGQILYSIVGEYLFQNILYPQGKIMASLCLLPSDPLAKRIVEFNRALTSALGHVDGITHMEVFHTPKDELIFIEIAARPPGSDIVPNYTQMLKLNFCALDVRIQAGEKITLSAPNIDEYSFIVRIPFRKTVVTELLTPDLKSQHHFEWKIKVGDVITHDSLTPMDFCAKLEVSNKNYEQLREDFKSLIHYQPYNYA
jgi:biotin carboxylase